MSIRDCICALVHFFQYIIVWYLLKRAQSHLYIVTSKANWILKVFVSPGEMLDWCLLLKHKTYSSSGDCWAFQKCWDPPIWPARWFIWSLAYGSLSLFLRPCSASPHQVLYYCFCSGNPSMKTTSDSTC